ncbi:transposase [Enterococcus florum]|uniref:Transposase n=1 Tax=Enterococcus florum TaxID=2480627 RepID=A0A4P5P4Q9_9ENTE|nr:RNA-guided endonuclease TnpB family protein [Enterococcus florum]GCF92640.1 transposase [Enterococcus florum]
MKVLKAYKFRLYPTEEQQRFFIETFGCVRFTYNMILMHRQLGGEKSEKLTPAKLKKQYPFLKKTDSLALANTQKNLERAFTNFFQGRAGYPKLKSKKSPSQSYTTNNQQHTIYLKEGKLKLPKLKTLVAVDVHRPINGVIKSATISARNNRDFYVSILCREEIQSLPATGKSVEISYCPEQLAELSADVSIEPFCQAELARKTAKAERKLKCRWKSAKRRKVKLAEAKNYQKQKQKVQQLYEQQLNQKKAYIDELSIRLMRDFDLIYVEAEPQIDDTNDFTNADWARFTQKLKYKADWYGKKVIIAAPSSSKG